MSFYINFKEGETFKFGLQITGLDDIQRVTVAFRNQHDVLFKQFSTHDDTLGDEGEGLYSVVFTDQMSLKKPQKGFWQFELESTSRGVVKSLKYRYEIVAATVRRGVEEEVIPGDFNQMFLWDYEAEVPELSDATEAFSYISLDALESREAAEAAAATATTKAGEASASAASALADKNTVASDKATVAADKATVAADKAIVIADMNTVAADKATVAADKAIVIADMNTVAADKATVAADKAIVIADMNTATTKAAEALVSANNAAASALAASAIVTGASTGLPSVGPAINWQFSKTKVLPRGITFGRSSPKTYYDQNGILRSAPANVPCFSHDPETLESLGLSSHEASTNLAWGFLNLDNCIFTTNFATAPDGTATAIKCENTPNVNSSIALINGTTTTNGFWTISMFVKPLTNNLTLIFENVGGTGTATINLTTKVWGGAALSALIDKGYENLQNGWMRIWLVMEKTSSNTVVLGTIYIGGYGSTSIQHSLLLWGAQAENKRYPTPYIYTSSGVASRAADVASFSSSLINTGGTWSLEAMSEQPGDSSRVIETPYASGNYWRVNFSSTYNIFILQASYSDVGVLSQSIALVKKAWQKIAFTLVSDNVRSSFNGAAVSTDTSCTILSGASLFLGSGLNGCIKQIAYYNQPQSNTQLQLLSGTSTNLIGDNPNQLPTAQKLSAGAYLSFAEMAALRQRAELNYHGTGSSVNYTIRRPYAFTLAIVNSNGSTTATLPSANSDGTYSPDTNYTLVHNAAVGTTLTVEIIPVIY